MEVGGDARLRTFEQAKSTLYGTISAAGAALEKASRRRQSTVTSVAAYLDRIQLDLSSLSVIHVTGTKGKGSTCAMVESVLRRHGFKTGLYTSPHLLEVTERVRCNGKPITKEAFARYFFQVWDRLQATTTDNTATNDACDGNTETAAGATTTKRTPEGKRSGDASKTGITTGVNPTGGPTVEQELTAAEMPTYFHLLTLVGLWCFVQEGVDVCVLEVGMGGRFDATNVVPSPVVCGVAMLDLDHTQILGDTLDKIAWEKGGIFKEGSRAMTVEQPRGGMSVLRECAQKAGCPGGLEVVKPLPPCDPSGRAYEIGLAGEHQRINAGLALRLCAVWMEAQQKQHKKMGDKEAFWTSAEVHAGLSECVWPGRCQVFRSPAFPWTTVYLDGAHTEQSMRACLEWFVEKAASKQSDTRKPPQTGQGQQNTRRRKRILWFNASHEREIVPLLDMLASARRRALHRGTGDNDKNHSSSGSSVNRNDKDGDIDDDDEAPLFDEAWFMEVNPGRPSRFKLPTAQEILAPIGIFPPTGDPAPPAAKAAKIEGTLGGAASSGRHEEAGDGASAGAWQRTLEQVWISLQERKGVRLSTTLTGTAPCFFDKLARMRATSQESGESGVEKASRGVDAGSGVAMLAAERNGDGQRGREQVDAVALSRDSSGGGGRHGGGEVLVEVLCTGSLYAVSAALEAFGAEVV